MTDDFKQVEILVVEDNPNDYELTARALKKINMANKVYWIKDGAEALEFIFCTGKYAKRSLGRWSQAYSSGFEAAQGGWHTSAKKDKSRPRYPDYPGSHVDFITGRERHCGKLQAGNQ